MTVSEYTHSQVAMLSLAWDGIAQSDVSSEYSSSYSELLEGILIAAGGSGTAELLSDTDLWAAIANQLGGAASSDTMTRPELIQEAVNALGGTANYQTDSEAEMIAQFANLLEGGLGNLILNVSLYQNSNTFYTHVLTGGAVTLTQSTTHNNTNTLNFTHTVTAAPGGGFVPTFYILGF